jgi:tetratricopeptide (TPR) repeat protein
MLTGCGFKYYLMKQLLKLLIVLLSIMGGASLYAQKQGQPFIDSLLKELPKQKDDTNKVNILEDLAFEYYRFSMPDSGIIFGEKENALAIKINWPLGVASANNVLGACNLSKNETSKSLAYFRLALRIYEQIGRKDRASSVAFNIGNLYYSIPDFAQALEYYFKALKIFESSNRYDMIAACNSAIGDIYNAIKDYTTAIEYQLKAVQIVDTCREVD